MTKKFELSFVFKRNSLIEFAILHAIVTFLSEICVVMCTNELKPIKMNSNCETTLKSLRNDCFADFTSKMTYHIFCRSPPRAISPVSMR